MTRHLILGGTGFIGRHIAEHLRDHGHNVTTAGRQNCTLEGIPHLIFDLRDASWQSVIEDYDVIHHYAWASVPSSADKDPLVDLDRHVRSTVALLEAAKSLGGKRVLFASSGGTVYGHLKCVPASETDMLRPIGIYGAAKLAVETYMGVYHRQGSVDCRIARLANPYGIRASTRTEQGLISIFARQALKNEPMIIWGNGEIIRDYIHITDVAEALTKLALAELTETEDPPIYNIGSGIGLSVNEVVALLQKLLRKQLSPIHREARGFDVPLSVLNIQRAHDDLGWTPKITPEFGISLLLAELSIK